MLSGKGPTSLLDPKSKTLRFFRRPISSGMQELRLLLSSRSSCTVELSLPKKFGRQPFMLLLASTTTETDRFPIFSGSVVKNLLLFKNNASKFMLKSFEGSRPSNSLNRMSRYLRLWRDRSAFGNFPTNRLLLRSSSNRRCRCLKHLGILPQNRLELMWKRARSVSRPSDSGNSPAMSLWLRSMPATTVVQLSSMAGAQKTPVYLQTSWPTQFPVTLFGSEKMTFFHECSAM
uniref:Uncharacterized protein n=1 Tax=Nymphaea colorata TaxID=210225 RepID=A0A5K0VDN5_9MAGN